jgi:polyphosphate glucokinase
MPSPAKDKVITLAIDIGGSGIKGCLLDTNGKALTERDRHETPTPATPDAVFAILDAIVSKLGKFDRVSVGFPGVVKNGVTLTAHNLDPAWIGCDLAKTLAAKWKKPVRVANDAAVQGLAAVQGKGVELVLTLGTGLGSSLYIDGRLVPGLELAHHPWRKQKTYEDFLGRHGFHKYGHKRWNKLVGKALVQIEALFNFDHCFIGGGNATKLEIELPKNVTRIPNEDGMLGGAFLWRD